MSTKSLIEQCHKKKSKNLIFLPFHLPHSLNLYFLQSLIHPHNQPCTHKKTWGPTRQKEDLQQLAQKVLRPGQWDNATDVVRRGQPFYYLLVPTSCTANSCFFSLPCFLFHVSPFPCLFILVLHPPRPKDRLDLWHLIHIFLSSLYFVINTNLQISTPYFPSFYYSFAHVCPFPLLPIWQSDTSDCSSILCFSTHTCNNQPDNIHNGLFLLKSIST